MKQAVKPGRLLLFIAVCLLILASAYLAVTRAADEEEGIKRGLDIAGGLYVLLEAVETGEEDVDADAIERAIAIIRMRVDELGVAEPVIAAQGDDRIRIELPDIEDEDRAREIIGRTARLSFVAPGGAPARTADEAVQAADEIGYPVVLKLESPGIDEDDELNRFALSLSDQSAVREAFGMLMQRAADYNPEAAIDGVMVFEEVVTGRHLRGARMERDPAGFSPHPHVSLEFDAAGARLFAEATGKYLGQPISIVLDSEVISAPDVRSVISDGQAVIEGDFTAEEAGELALLLRSGALPVELRELESRLIGPTLGRRTEDISIRAAAIGLGAVFLFMLLYYRFAGLIAGVALVFYLTLVLAVLTVLPTTLTLPGIAGLILSIGMAVDANVIIFERIKDELRSGRTVRTAMEGGFQRAFRTILDANVTTIIATVVLFALASGPVRGFAVTLFIGIICSMITAIVLTRFLLRLSFRAGILRSGRYVGVKI